MRCAARIRPSSLLIRSRFNTDRTNQCNRQADPGFRTCYQHRMCQKKDCDRFAHVQIRDWSGMRWQFCPEHAQMYREHDRIVNRILEIPPHG